MTDFEGEKHKARADHAAWSGAQLEKLTKTPDAIRAAIKSGWINNLTKEDRDRAIETLAATKTNERAAPTTPAARRPQAFGAARRAVSFRQPWQKGELAYAIKRAAIWWCAVVVCGLSVLEVLRWTAQQ